MRPSPKRQRRESTEVERQAVRDSVDSLVSRVAAAGYPSDALRAEVTGAGDDLARLHGLAFDLSLWLDEQGLGTLDDRRWRASLDDD